MSIQFLKISYLVPTILISCSVVKVLNQFIDLRITSLQQHLFLEDDVTQFLSRYPSCQRPQSHHPASHSDCESCRPHPQTWSSALGESQKSLWYIQGEETTYNVILSRDMHFGPSYMTVFYSGSRGILRKLFCKQEIHAKVSVQVTDFMGSGCSISMKLQVEVAAANSHTACMKYAMFGQN